MAATLTAATGSPSGPSTTTDTDFARSLHRVRELGWCVKIQPEATGIVGQVEKFEALDLPVAIDHMGRPHAEPGATALDDVRLRIPVPNPAKIICVGVNCAERDAGHKDGSELPRWPSVFPRFARSFTGHRGDLLRPPESAQLDYEGEIAIVIGKAGRRIREEDAEAHIAGLACLNEGTVRGWTRHGKFNVTQGKNWDASGAIGPWLVTADESPDGYGNLRVQTRVNGE
jgi:2-keto-4-pentenoate hydratase/2-oxohepta-3-ene-1,7-dioic acid hydratase in catechol pathway